MICSGNPSEFAILAQIERAENEWLFGNLRFCFQNRDCGDWSDCAALNCCYSWLKQFSEEPTDRFAPDLLRLPARRVFEQIVDPVLANRPKTSQGEAYPNAYARFHLSHLGMSSFEKIIMVLVEDHESQRCLWEDRKRGVIMESLLQLGQMQKTARLFCEELKMEADKLGLALS